MSSSTRLRTALGVLLVVGLFAGALWILSTELRSLDPVAVWRSALATPPLRLLAAAGCVAVSFACQGTYDVLALRAVGHPQAWRTVAPTGIAAQVVGQNFGAAVLTGGAVRARSWTRLGVPPTAMVAAALLVSATQALGVAVVLGAALTIGLHTQFATYVPTRVLGVGLLAVPLLWLALARWGKSITLRGRTLQPPTPLVAMAQVGVGALDWVAVGSAFTLLVADLPLASVPSVFVGFWEAQVAGALSHVPGGAGVFEATLLLALPDHSTGSLMASMVLFRVLYYLLPLGLVMGVAATHLHARIPVAVPSLAAGVVGGLGVLLSLSAVLPAEPHYLHLLRSQVPLPLMETAHTVSAGLGLLLVALARPLLSRSRAAHRLATALLVVGAIAALLRGLDWFEGSLAFGAAGFLLAVRGRFDQPTALRAPTPVDLVLIATTVVAAAWTTWMLYGPRHAADLVEFAWAGDASRAVRASAVVAALTVVFGAAAVLRSRPLPAPLPTPEELARARAIAVRSLRPDGWLALLGDKALLFEGDEAFMMCGSQGRSCIAMTGPIGSRAAAARLVRRFTADALSHDLRPVAYEVPAADLELWIEEGYQAFKIGQFASVPLEGFDLATPTWKKLRQAVARAEREGMTFRVIEPPIAPADLAPLRSISERWLAGKAEKGFSLGWFDEAYLTSCPIAVVEVHGEVVAFANLWSGAPGGAATLDLMRHAGAPNGTMDFLFTKLLVLAKDRGFASFELGMAPLSGLDDAAAPKLWDRLGHAIFEHGDRFYSFEGLRSYKEKFNPVWESRYLMVRNRQDALVALTDVTLLIRRGPRVLPHP